MADFDFPSLDTIWTKARALWAAERPNASVFPRSDVWLSTYVAAKLWNRLHKTADNVLRAVFPSTTFGVYLDYWLRMLGASDGSGGLGRIIARGSTGGETDVTFTGVGTVTLGDQLTDADGLTYEFSATYTSAGAETTAVGVQAVSTGSATNLDASDAPTLTITTPGANVNAATTLSADLDDGADDEADSAGRARLLELLRRGPSGSWSDFEQIIEEASPGNLDGYVWPKRENQPQGWGRTDYCALQTGETGTDMHIGSGDALYTTIGNAIDANMPVLLWVNSRQLTLTTDDIDVECTLTINPDADSTKFCDWDAESKKVTVAAQVDPLITCSAQIDDVMTKGDKVIIEGVERTTTDVGVADGLANTQFKVSGTWAWDAGTVGKSVLSGGGLIADVIDSIGGFFDTLGPAKGDYAAPVTDWKDDIYSADIQSDLIVMGDGDIVNVEVDELDGAPATATTQIAPTAGSGATTERLMAGEIIIWEDK